MAGVLPPASERPGVVAEMFGRIAGRYDRMNSLMTLGLDAGWRRAVADAARVPSRGRRGRILDVGTGTGKLALAVAERVPGAQVVGVDFALPMLRAGRPALGARVPVAAADGLRLPFAPERFDAVVSAFVVRNLADAARGVGEQARVLRPGGRLVVLETTPGPSAWLRPLFRLYFRHLVPLLGRLVVGDARAYTYLPESAAAFLEPERLADLLRASGLVDVRLRRLGLGSVALVAGRKPATPG